MKSWDYYAVAYDGEVYCKECLPEGVEPDGDEVSPIFAGSEWDYIPACTVCGTAHDYMVLLGEI